MTVASTAPPSRLLLVTAFAALYLIWGSTYIAIKLSVATMPPWPMIAARHLMAGVILYAILRFSGTPAPRREHWRGGVIGGVMLLAIGNGMIAFSAHRVPSGLASMVVATTPIWMVAAAATRPSGRAPQRQEWLGLVLGLVGLCLLAGPSIAAAMRDQAGAVDLGGVGLVLIGTISWAIGSIIGREMPRPDNAFMGSALQMLAGGAILSLACLVTGQWQSVQMSTVSLESWLAFGYLILFGSLLGFTAYVWLLRVAKTSHVATYAFVNPVVALLLGVSIGHETITGSMLVAAGITLLGVVFVVMPPIRTTT